MGKRKRKEKDEEDIRKKIRKLEKKLREAPQKDAAASQPEPEEQTAQGSENTVEQLVSTEDDELPEEFLEALGNEGQETTEVGEAIRPELKLRWSSIMCNGMGKDAKEAITKKYPTPENFPNCKAPLMNPEILAAMSELTLKRDRRIMARQNLTATLITCLGKSLTNILRGNLITKNLIEEISNAAKLAAQIFHEDSSSRKFFALAGANPTVKEAVREAKTEKYLFGEDCAEKIKTAQAVKKTGSQIKTPVVTIKPSAKGQSQGPATIRRQGNWRGPPQQYQYHHQHQRGRGGHRPQQVKKFHQSQNPPHPRDQRRNQHRSRPNYRRY